MTDHGGAASPRTEAGKRLLAYLFEPGKSDDLGLAGDDPQPWVTAIRAIEAEAAQEAPAPEGLRAALKMLHERNEAFNPPNGRGLLFPGAYSLDHKIGENPTGCDGCIAWLATPEAAQEAPAPEGLDLDAFARAVERAYQSRINMVWPSKRGLDTAQDIVRALPGFVPGVTVSDESTGFGLEPSPFGDEADWLQRGVVLSALSASPNPAEPPRQLTDEEFVAELLADGEVELADAVRRITLPERAEARPPEGLDVERLRGAIYAVSLLHNRAQVEDERTEEIAAEYARLSAGGATKP